MKLASIALATALSLAAGASFAEQASPPGPGQGPGPRAGHMQGQQMAPGQMAERHAQRLRDALQLRPEQEPALKALVAAMQPPPGEMARRRQEREADRALPTPQRLDRMQARMAERDARFRQHADAIKRFYAQLTPAQQKAFDAMPMMGHGMMGEGMMGPGRGHGMRPGAPGAAPQPKPPTP